MRQQLRSLMSVFSLGWQSLVFLVMGLFLALCSPTLAQDSKIGASVGYKVNGAAAPGSLVSTDNSQAGSVKPATIETVNDLVGVIVAPEEPLLSIDSAQGQRQVAINGLAYALVSDVNGPVKKGDYITASFTAGIGMKATSSARVLGSAQSDLSQSANIQTIHAKNFGGQTVSAKVGRILVLVNVGYYGGPPNVSHGLIPQALQDFSDNVVGHQVSQVRILISSLLLLVALLISVSLVYSAVRSSIISIGRNPLSKSTIQKKLVQILGLVGLILLVTLISIYLILSR